MRFLLALVGLILAFAAALFSTVSRESGNLWATAVLASTALLLAALVGLTTVPYLARRAVVERWRDSFDYEVTAAGIVYVVATLLIGVAALNTGNNLLYIVVSAMLAAVLVSGTASAMVLNSLEVELHLPEHVFSRRSVTGRLLLRNPRRWLPSVSVGVLPPKVRKARWRWRWERSVFTFPPGRPAGRQWLRLSDRSLRRVADLEAAPPIFQGSAYFPVVPAGGIATADLDLKFDRRGRYQQEGLSLVTRFPFALLTKKRKVALARDLIVYPPVQPTDELFEVLPLIRGESEAFVRGRGCDLYRIREYLPEDSARHVDWKATAKSGALKVREFTREDERKLRLVFDNPAPEQISAEAYERGIALAASLAWHFAGENTDMSFVAPGYQGGPEAYAFLKYLALLQPGTQPSVLEHLPLSEEYNLVLTTRPRGTIPTALWTCSYFLFFQDRG
jgi:uncharacterized protein (DUF58 family)